MPARVMVRVLVGLVLVLAILAPRLGRAQSGDDPVVAVVNGEPIHRSEVVTEMAALPAHYRELSRHKLYPVVLNRIIDARLLLAEGLRRGLDADERVRRRVAKMSDRLIQEELLDRHVRANVKPEAVRAGYDDYVRQKLAVRQVRARHILLDTEDQAREMIERLRQGADFAALAKAHSIGPSAPRGGDLGTFGPDDMLREITEVAFRLDPGAVSDQPVESPFGWHVIKVEEAHKVAPLSFEEAREELTTALSRRVIAELIQALRMDAQIVRYDIDGDPAPEGMFDDAPVGTDPLGDPRAPPQ